MVRVLFLAAPSKARMILRMTEEFSPEITHRVVTMSYPYSEAVALAKRPVQKAGDLLFGGRSLFEAVVKFKPDIIYSDSALYGAQYKVISYALRRRKPLVVHLNGDWWREQRATFCSARWKRKLLMTQSYAYHSASMVLASKITPICRWLERVVIDHVPHKRTQVVYQGVDPEQLFPESGFDFRRPAVAMVQNHTVYDKVAGLLKFKAVIQKMPKVNFYVAEGEKGSQTFLPLVKRHFSDVHNVHFVSNVNTIDGVRKMLTAADCYVLASGLDCCPTTVLEASLMRKAVVASRVAGVPETILEAKTGWTVPNGSINVWVEKINLLIDDAKLNRQLGDQGRKWVSHTFGWKTIADQVEKLLISEVK